MRVGYGEEEDWGLWSPGVHGEEESQDFLALRPKSLFDTRTGRADGFAPPCLYEFAHLPSIKISYLSLSHPHTFHASSLLCHEGEKLTGN